MYVCVPLTELILGSTITVSTLTYRMFLATLARFQSQLHPGILGIFRISYTAHTFIRIVCLLCTLSLFFLNSIEIRQIGWEICICFPPRFDTEPFYPHVIRLRMLLFLAFDDEQKQQQQQQRTRTKPNKSM